MKSPLGTDGTIFRLEALRQVEGFDKNIRGAAEDTDVILRIRKEGWTFSANEDAQFYHNCRQRLENSGKSELGLVLAVIILIINMDV